MRRRVFDVRPGRQVIGSGSGGHVGMGVAPPDGGTGGHGRIETWRRGAGAEEER